jgi:O-antigen ligase
VVNASASAAPSPQPIIRSPLRETDWPLVAWRLVCGFAVSIPFSIAIAQVMLVLAVVAAAIDWQRRGRPLPHTPIDLPVLGFAASGLLAAFVGLHPVESLWGLRTYLQVVIVYLVYAYVDSFERARDLIRCFLVGSAVTSLYTVLGRLAPVLFPRLFLGQMTQSGQLLFAIGITLSLIVGGTLRGRSPRVAFALYVLALVCNLKRGVWLGVVVTVLTVGLFMGRRLVLVAGLVIVLALTTVPPVRARIGNATRDLLLPGNRRDIWAAAIDVVHRFPMGVGRKNGEILRDYPNIPSRHKHAHNNLLQVTLENGWLGLAMFLWWMGTYAKRAWAVLRRIPTTHPFFPLAVAVFSTFVGFHVAGLVEYNFGDSEVLEIFLLTMGLGLIVDRGTGRGE